MDCWIPADWYKAIQHRWYHWLHLIYILFTMVEQNNWNYSGDCIYYSHIICISLNAIIYYCTEKNQLKPRV
jgi:hypothetical protein